MKAAYAANEIAEYLLWLAARENEEEPGYLTPMQLQKLLYYVQGWALAETGAPLFGDEIRAWANGPVVEAVYQHFKALGKRPIVDTPAQPPRLAPDAEAIVRGVWDRYKIYSAFKLSDMTHEEMPWKKARAGKAEHERSNVLIPLTDLATEFAGQVERSKERLSAHAHQIRAMARGRASSNGEGRAAG
jgi:uncharacterized phage-associated protein